MKNILYLILFSLCLIILVGCTANSACYTVCEDNAFCDSADGKCECELGYAKDSISGKCTLLSRDFFLGEWTAKDTLCSDSCRTIPYKVRFYKHPTDEKLCYVSNFASQLCSTNDTAVWLVTTWNYKIVKIQSTSLNCINPLYFSSYNYNINLKRLDYYFYVIVNQDTITWRTILER